MAIPDYQTLMLPLLRFCADGSDHRIGEAVAHLADEFRLTEDERRTMLPSGLQTIIVNRVGWARTYLVKALLLEVPKRGYVNISARGMDMLNRNPERIDVRFLEQFQEFREFRQKRNPQIEPQDQADDDSHDNQTPAEAIDYAYQQLRHDLARELLDQVKACSPEFFERLVVEVLVAMGYGGSRKDAGETVGRSGDGGIDGIIKEDRLGLDVIYIQAKRWQNTVSRPEIQKFVGALQGQRARKGIFITTSDFTKEAVEFARNLESKVILIDGQRLAELMIDYGVGVAKVVSYNIKRVDSDYFVEE
jgi:restriction system protein